MLLAGGLAEQPRLWGLVASEVWRRFRRRMRSGPIAKWRFAGRASIRAFGLDVVTALCDNLLQNGAPGLHFYTLNQAGPTTTIWQRLGL